MNIVLFLNIFFPLFSQFGGQLYPIYSNFPYCCNDPVARRPERFRILESNVPSPSLKISRDRGSETSVSRALLYTAIQHSPLSCVSRALLYTAIQHSPLSCVSRALLYTAIQHSPLSCVSRALLYTAIQHSPLSCVSRAILYTAILQPLLSPRHDP